MSASASLISQSTSGWRLSPFEEQNEKLQLINDIYAEVPSIWVEDEFGLKLDNWQITMLDSPKKRICLNIHRQGGKSLMSSLVCAHTAQFRPGSLSLIIAPALTQSREDFEKVQEHIDQMSHPPKLLERTKLRMKWDNGSRIVCLPGGTKGKTIRGFSRPDVIIEDESSQCSDQLYQAIRPMMATYPDCKFVLASTPFGQRGHFYKVANGNSTAWLRLKVVASECSRISAAFLAEEKEELGPYVYSQEYEGEFVASETQLISHASILKAISDNVEIIEV